MSRRLGRGARRRQVYAVCATHLLPGRARLPALCYGSRQGCDPLAQLQAMLPGTRVEAGVTRPLLSQSRDSTSRRGLSAAGRDAQSRPVPRQRFYRRICLVFSNILLNHRECRFGMGIL